MENNPPLRLSNIPDIKAQVRDMISGEGGGGSINLLTEYTAEPTDIDSYSASYVNSRLDAIAVKIGIGASAPLAGVISGPIAIGRNSLAQGLTNGQNLGVAIGWGAKSYNLGEVNNSVAIGSSAKSMGYGVAIGNDAGASQNFNSFIALGRGAQILGENATAIGPYANCNHPNSTALGGNTITSRVYETSIGNYISGETRFLANVRDAELDTDATNLGQVKALIAESTGGGSSSGPIIVSDTHTRAYQYALRNITFSERFDFTGVLDPNKTNKVVAFVIITLQNYYDFPALLSNPQGIKMQVVTINANPYATNTNPDGQYNQTIMGNPRNVSSDMLTLGMGEIDPHDFENLSMSIEYNLIGNDFTSSSEPSLQMSVSCVVIVS